MNSSYKIENSYAIYTDCTSSGAVLLSIPFLSVNTQFVGNVYGDPCTRIDKAWIYGVGLGDYYPGSNGYVSGTDPIGNCYPLGYTHNTGTHVQYRLQGNSTWLDISWLSGQPGVGSSRGPYVYYWELNHFYLSSGTYEFRYRNFMTNNPNVEPPVTTCFGPWSHAEIVGIP